MLNAMGLTQDSFQIFLQILPPRTNPTPFSGPTVYSHVHIYTAELTVSEKLTKLWNGLRGFKSRFSQL